MSLEINIQDSYLDFFSVNCGAVSESPVNGYAKTFLPSRNGTKVKRAQQRFQTFAGQ